MPKLKAIDPDGLKPRVSDDDVEGHGRSARAIEPDGALRAVRGGGADELARPRISRPRVDGDEADTEGHSMLGNPYANEQLARAREQEIQRHLKAHTAREVASRPHKK